MNYYTKNDIIYEKLKDRIIDGKLAPGQRLVIFELANEFNVSPMPVREAIKRLQQDGFLEVIPHVGARVASFDLNKFKEIVLIRMELEPLAARLATPYINADKIKELEQIILDMERAIKDKNYTQYAQLNKKFHIAIYSASPYQYLYELIMSLWTKSEFSRTIFSKFNDRMEVSIAEHKMWLQAIKDGDSQKSGNILRAHKENAFKKLIDSYEKDM